MGAVGIGAASWRGGRKRLRSEGLSYIAETNAFAPRESHSSNHQTFREGAEHEPDSNHRSKVFRHSTLATRHCSLIYGKSWV